ncbi:GCN5-related N-acetyltransferase [Emticicia oligotrophica DSM 17448]|uniref:GCN5-related N-acetyltransferase n=1 Tax=Emticicia oligotrophica (strain DSM 17448 / CIP 109782 / MTCC 6937 / GPTSA100-15) TaxID=929562 RepID=A0ABM5MY66_EMTOG|nr:MULTISPECIES: GNAT family N-acetyltransferase [Emticicia]AFK02046.1 GCN5-related N-acetyltransferase [Emticicia oligotrophica DSM 17448]
MDFQLKKYTDNYRQELIKVWESSVRATHHFLSEEDILFYKSLVEGINFNEFDVYCSFTATDELIAFMGVAENKLEMLFLNPNYIGKGLGKQLTLFAINELKVNEVEVNEDNENAIKFYKKIGFKIFDRTPLDGCGKPYPILKMRL